MFFNAYACNDKKLFTYLLQKLNEKYTVDEIRDGNGFGGKFVVKIPFLWRYFLLTFTRFPVYIYRIGDILNDVLR